MKNEKLKNVRGSIDYGGKNAIKDLYNQTVEYYKKDIDKMYSSETNDLYYDLNFYECKYRYYINSDILSICVFQKIGGQDSSTNNYLAYNFDLKTGNLVRYEDICKAIDFPIEEANEKVKKVIRNYEVYVYMEENEYYEDELLDSLKEKGVKNFEENNFQYFISDNGILNIIVQIDVPAGGGEFNTLFKVHKEDNFNNYELYNMREMKDGNSFVKYIENENTDMYESWYTINRNEGTKWHFAEKINAPYINLKSEDAKKANEEIKDEYNKMCEYFSKELLADELISKTAYSLSYYYVIED